jgi:hypothetical protein
LGESGEAGDLDAVGAVGGSRMDFADENDAVAPLFDGDGVIAHPRELLFDLRELVVMGREKGARPGFGQVCQTQAFDLGYDLSALRASGNHNYASKFNPKLPYK